jgi:hypothetical protein
MNNEICNTVKSNNTNLLKLVNELLNKWGISSNDIDIYLDELGLTSISVLMDKKNMAIITLNPRTNSIVCSALVNGERRSHFVDCINIPTDVNLERTIRDISAV